MSKILAPKKDGKKSQNVAGLKNVKVAWNKHLNIGLFKVSHMPIFFICVFREDIFVFRGTIRCLRFVFWNWHNRYCLFICLYSWTFVICVIVLLKLITSQLISKRENLIFELPSYSNIWKASHQSKWRQKHPRWKWWVVHGLNPWLQ